MRGDTVGVAYLGETPDRTARELLLEREIELRRAMETIAAARRDLPDR
jgi:predicted dithiol-disulfide oxidoreductase (DUF899 family)